MESEELTLWIQASAIVVAVVASIVALFISWRDRVNARLIASEDRRAALQQAKLMFDLEALLRLLENQNRGGSTDDLERAQLGAETMALVGLIGEDRLPILWKRRIGYDDAGLRAKLTTAESETPTHMKHTIETQLALNEVVREIYAAVNRK
ncbi:hypothetical protein I6E81_12485 [Salinibacterium sp. NG22]|uniref:hypothetical protein n=1 Tax=Salinibacterium sp. NG22 TaxID=2792040 RepID=UPI0018CD9DAC|nr:hypothetical protein [Salinibacterium sp. NG22]MBH0110986.1 hypothetical protein [Salinibacterium sp. NG22]